MPATSTPARTNSGFTLIEVLVVAPMVILIIGVLVAVIVSMTGSALVAQSRNQLASSTQTALTDIERDLIATSELLSSTGTLPVPQGVNNDTSGFTASDQVLVISTPALTASSLSSSRDLVYYENTPNACSSPDVSLNEVVYATNIYFVSNGSLWRRTVLPGNVDNACSAPWQKNSCAPGQTASVCTRPDTELVELGTGEANFTYYDQAGDEASPITPGDVASVDIDITASREVAGRTVTISNRLRIPID